MTAKPSPPEAFAFDPVRAAAWLVSGAVAIAFLVLGQPLLVPLAIAIFIWTLLGAIRATLQNLLPARYAPPIWLQNLVAISIVGLATYLVVLLITSQADALRAAIPGYQSNFAAMTAKLTEALGLEALPATESVVQQLNIAAILGWIGDSAAALASNVILIAIYVGFLLAEEHVIPGKLTRLQSDDSRASRVLELAEEVSSSVQRYIGMKTVISLATAIVSYLILLVVGVDFAAIWAILVFFLNFIPTIGSIVAAIFPALLTLIQFDTLTPFLIVAAGLGITQFLFGNVIEPAYMGRSLNLSALMILLSLSFWGIVWGVAGMFLAVPIMVMTGIVCAQFPQLRWIAVMLSTDGRVMGELSGEQE